MTTGENARSTTGGNAPSTRMELRPSLRMFAEEMERVLQSHDFKKGDSWKDCDLRYLTEKFTEEYAECVLTLRPLEFVDLANLCLMLWVRRSAERLVYRRR